MTYEKQLEAFELSMRRAQDMLVYVTCCDLEEHERDGTPPVWKRVLFRVVNSRQYARSYALNSALGAPTTWRVPLVVESEAHKYDVVTATRLIRGVDVPHVQDGVAGGARYQPLFTVPPLARKLSNFEFGNIDVVIHVGAQGGITVPAASAAAIVVTTLRSHDVAEHALFHARDNVAVMEVIAARAALVAARRIVDDSGNKCNVLIISDVNMRVADFVNDATRARHADRTRRDQIVAEYRQAMPLADEAAHQHIFFATIGDDVDVKPADALAGNTIVSARSVGDASLFSTCGDNANRGGARARGVGAAGSGGGGGGGGGAAVINVHPANLANARVLDMMAVKEDPVLRVARKITSIEQFAHLYHFQCLRTVPLGAEGALAALVKNRLYKIINAQSAAERSEHMMALIVLPWLFLPRNRRPAVLIAHIAEGKIFDIEIPTTEKLRAEAATRAGVDNSKGVPLSKMARQARLIERKTRNHQPGSAARTMMMMAKQQQQQQDRVQPVDETAEQQQQRIDAEHKRRVDILRSKFPPLDDDLQRELDVIAREPPEETPPFEATVVLDMLRHMNRESANGIDAWCPAILKAVIDYDMSIAQDIGVVANMMIQAYPSLEQLTAELAVDKNNNDGAARNNVAAKAQRGGGGSVGEQHYFTEFMVDIFRLGRLVGIDKDEGADYRSIVMSCFFAKVAGACALLRSKVEQLPNQFAVKCPGGLQKAVHRTRLAYNLGKVVCKVDLRNAYNTASREKILSVLNECFADDAADMTAFFKTMYARPSKMIIFGPGGKQDLVECATGVLQGSSASSFLFCTLLVHVQAKLREAVAKRFDPSVAAGVDVYMYMDDISLCCHPSVAVFAAHELAKLVGEAGFDVNTEKSAIIHKNGANAIFTDVPSADSYRVRARDEQPSSDSDDGGGGMMMMMMPTAPPPPPPQRQRQRRAGGADDQLDLPENDEKRQRRPWEDVVDYERIIFDSDDAAPDYIELAPPFRIANEKEEPFVVLGAVINEVYTKFTDKLIQRARRFFEAVDALSDHGVHPEITWTIMYWCGRIRLYYHCSVTPPEFSEGFAKPFCDMLERSFAKLIRVEVQDIDRDLLYSNAGGCLIDYNKDRKALYDKSRDDALGPLLASAKSSHNSGEQLTKSASSLLIAGAAHAAADLLLMPSSLSQASASALAASYMPLDPLINTPAMSATMLTPMPNPDVAIVAAAAAGGGAAAAADASSSKCNLWKLPNNNNNNNKKNENEKLENEKEIENDGIDTVHTTAFGWHRYSAVSHTMQLTPRYWIIAMAMRVGCVPRLPGLEMRSAVRCCNQHFTTAKQIIEHALVCSDLANIPYYTRHNFVRDALHTTAMRYSIYSIKEPSFYEYGDGVKHRPDIVFFPPDVEPVACDVTIVHSSKNDKDPVGAAAAAAAAKKVAQHQQACLRRGHRFFAFAMEPNGFMDTDCFKMIRYLAKSLPRNLAYCFTRDMQVSASAALAKFRAHAVESAFGTYDRLASTLF